LGKGKFGPFSYLFQKIPRRSISPYFYGMARFYKFLVMLLAFLLILSFLYALTVYFGLFEALRALWAKNMIIAKAPISHFVEPALITALILSLAQVAIIAGLLKRAIERAIKFSIMNILRTVVAFFLATTSILILQISSYLMVEDTSLWGLLRAYGSINSIGLFTFPLGWTLLFLYLVRRYKLTGPVPEDNTFEFETDKEKALRDHS